MKNLFFLLLAITIVSFSACEQDPITPSETITTESFDLPTITALSASDDFVVFYTDGADEQSIEIEANLNLQELIEISEENGLLKVGLENNVSIRGNETLILRLSTSAPVNDFRVASDAEINLQTPLNVENLFFKAASDGLIRGAITADFMEADVASDGRLELIGEVDRLDAELSSDGELVDFDLTINHLDIQLSSDASAELTVVETLRAVATSDGSLRYRGDPEVLQLETSSDGTVEKVD